LPEDEFLPAESYFNDNLLSSVENAKLDRPMDSTLPLERSVHVAQKAYWGEPWGHDQAYQSDEWYGEDWDDDNEEHLGYSMDYKEDQDGNGEDTDEEIYMAQDNEGQGHNLLEEGDPSDEEDDDSYE
jgi:hypothetical protein